MIHPNLPFLRATGTLIGSIVGVGVFGLPYAFAQSGFVVGALWLAVLAALLTALQLMYAEVVMHTEETHRLSGYVKVYLGKPAGKFTLWVFSGAIWGAMTAYLIVGGKFLHVLLTPVFGGSEWVYTLVFGGVAATLMWRGIRFASKIELGIVCAILFLFLFSILAALPYFHPSFVTHAYWDKAFLPYGVVLFALTGIAAVPEMKVLLGRRQESKLPYAILLAMTLIVGLYFCFAFAVVGATGLSTTEAAFDGLVPLLGSTFGVVGAVLGVVTVLSGYMLVGVEFQNSLVFDQRMRRLHAFLLVVGVPVVAYLAGLQSFIHVIGFVGAVFSGLIGIIIVLMYEKMRRSPVCDSHRCLNVPSVVSWVLMAVFFLGIIHAVVSLFL